MSVSYFCNNCENEDNFIVIQGVVHCDVCQSSDVEVVKADGSPYADEINEDLFYDDLEDLYNNQQVGISELKEKTNVFPINTIQN